MKRTLLLVIVVVMTLGIVACVDTTEESATQVFINGEIFTANEEMLWAGSLAISGDNIICVAEDNSCEEMAGNGTFVVDLDGKMMTPGFIDTHAHMGSAPGLVWGVDITEAETLEDHINMMIGYKAEIDALPEAQRLSICGAFLFTPLSWMKVWLLIRAAIQSKKSWMKSLAMFRLLFTKDPAIWRGLTVLL
ncbi:MAG: hypothetical protein AB2540_04205 [Candidatus Thiodiazotropha endolucinida]